MPKQLVCIVFMIAFEAVNTVKINPVISKMETDYPVTKFVGLKDYSLLKLLVGCGL